VNTVWFIVLGAFLTGYAILDGIDLGVGGLHLSLSKTDSERRADLNAIGPVWAGYEVWLVAAGGSMVAAFPRLYAASLSGFYLVLTLVLWLLIARGGSIEIRSQVDDPLWKGFWDVVFCVSSLLLAVLFGAAVGNVVRGVPLDSSGNFAGSFEQALNPFAILAGVLSVALLAMHGAHFLAVKTEEEQQERAQRYARVLWYVVAILSVAASLAAFAVRPGLTANFAAHLYLSVLPLIALGALVAVQILQRRKDYGKALIASGVLIAGLMSSAGASIYPLLLPALGQPGQGLSIDNAAAPHHNLVTALIANLVAMTGVILYGTFIHRIFRGKVRIEEGEHGY
jgi:cytochrome d ubiquinol oxidase subunit II